MFLLYLELFYKTLIMYLKRVNIVNKYFRYILFVFFELPRYYFEREIEKDPQSVRDSKVKTIKPALSNRPKTDLMQIPSLFIRIMNHLNYTSPQTIGNIYGALLSLFIMLIRTGGSSVIHSLPKSLHSIQILWIESSLIFVFLCLFFNRTLFTIIVTQKFWLQIAKAACNITGTFCLFEALKRLPLAISSTLSLSSILFSVIGSFLFFSEKLNMAIFIGILFAINGFILISGCEWSHFSMALCFPIIAAFFFSLSTLISKEIALFDSLKTSVFWLFFIQTIFTAIPSYIVWTPITYAEISRIAVTATILLLSIPLTLQSESFSAIAFLAPFKCTRILFSSFFGWLFFHETLSKYSWLGISLIVLSHIILWKNHGRIASYYIHKKGEQALHKKIK